MSSNFHSASHSVGYFILLTTAVSVLAACAGPKPVAYRSLDSAAYLHPNTGEDARHIPYAYDAHPDWSHYSSLILEPVTIYQGSDNQFGSLSAADRATLAQSMLLQFTATLGKHFRLTTTPDNATLRVKLTLTGAQANTPVVSTFSRFDIAGNLYNGVQAVRGGNGMGSGWVMFAVEVYDASSGQLLKAYETKQYPFAYNIPATLGRLSAAKVGIGKGAEALALALQ